MATMASQKKDSHGSLRSRLERAARESTSNISIKDALFSVIRKEEGKEATTSVVRHTNAEKKP